MRRRGGGNGIGAAAGVGSGDNGGRRQHLGVMAKNAAAEALRQARQWRNLGENNRRMAAIKHQRRQKSENGSARAGIGMAA